MSTGTHVAPASAGVDRVTRAVLAALCVAVIVGTIVVGSVGALAAARVLVALPVLALVALFPRAAVTHLTVDAEGVTVAWGRGQQRRFPRAQVTHAWVVGVERGGWLLDLASGSCLPLLVLADADGRVTWSRKLGPMRVEALARAFAAQGYAFHGVSPVPFHPSLLRPAEWPEGVAPPGPGPGLGDRPTRDAVDAARRRARVRTIVGWVLVFALPNIAGALHADKHDQPLYGITWALEVGVLFVLFGVLIVGAVRSRAWRAANRHLKVQPWLPVRVVVLGAYRRNRGKRALLVLDGATGAPVKAFRVDEGGERGWLQPVEQAWFVLAVAADGKQAVLAPPDRSAFALLHTIDLPTTVADVDRLGLG